MPAYHDSVTRCDRCDWYVAVIEVGRCEECRAPICPGCSLSTDDLSVLVCSQKCRAIFNHELAEEAA
jgi:hypothetical protein